MSLPVITDLPGEWVPAGADVLAAAQVEHEPVLIPWRTAIWAQADGQIVGGGVLTGTRVDDEGRLRIECTGISGAAIAGQPWTADPAKYLEADPLDIVRDIYAHVRAQEGGNLGLEVTDTASPVRVGTPEDPARRIARLRVEQIKPDLDQKKATYDKAKKHAAATTQTALAAAGHKDLTGKLVVAELDSEGNEPSKTKKNLWYRPSKNRVHKVVERMVGKAKRTSWEAVPAALPAARVAAAAIRAEEAAKKEYDAVKSVSDKARQAYDAVKDRQAEDAFTLDWWSTLDLGRVVDDLAGDTPFDMIERTSWDSTGERLVHRLELSYPRRGRRRTDLRFVIGENVTVPRESVWGDDYASELQVLGAGEGHKMIRAAQPTGAVGIRRVRTHTDKAIGKQTTAAKRARILAPAFTGGLNITEVTAFDHPHARLGEIGLGDEIRLVGRIDWADIDLWLRVVAITYRPKQPAAIVLRVTPS